MSYTYRNVVQLAAILHRYTSPVDTGVLVVQSSDDVPQSGTTRTQSVDAVFFTCVHFDIFGLFFPNDVPDLGSATKLLMRVYDVENLTLCVAISPQQSSSSSSLLLNTRCEGVVNRTLGQRTEVFDRELVTLRRFYPAFFSHKTCTNSLLRALFSTIRHSVTLLPTTLVPRSTHWRQNRLRRGRFCRRRQNTPYS